MKGALKRFGIVSAIAALISMACVAALCVTLFYHNEFREIMTRSFSIPVMLISVFMIAIVPALIVAAFLESVIVKLLSKRSPTSQSNQRD